MEITITGRHLDVTPAIRDYAQKKADKLLKYYDRVQAIDVVIYKAEHHHHGVEMKVIVDRTEPFISKTQGLDLYACIDEVEEKIERQLRDHKTRVRQRKGKTPMGELER